MQFLLIIGLTILSIGCISAQQQLPYDYFDPCWFNVSGELNDSYSQEEIDFIQLFLDMEVMEPLSSVNETIDIAQYVRDLTQKVSLPLFFDDPGVDTLGDVYKLFDTIFVTIEQLNISLPDQDLYTYLVAGYNYVLHTCIDGSPTPDYESLVRYLMSEMTRKYVAQEIVAESNEEGINAVAIALVYIWGVMSDTPIDIQQAITVIVGGITDAIQDASEIDSVAIIDIDSTLQAINIDIVSLLSFPQGMSLMFGDTMPFGLFTGSNAVRLLTA